MSIRPGMILVVCAVTAFAGHAGRSVAAAVEDPKDSEILRAAEPSASTPAAAAASGAVAKRVGIGVLGDSFSDEYGFYLPHRTQARNWVEILASTRGLDFGEFTQDHRGEPRGQGYAYNWAKSDADTEDLIRTGQHLGLAQQVREGRVGVVFVFAGANDFIHALQAHSEADQAAKIRVRAEKNYQTAVRTILDAHKGVRIILATVPDLRTVPEFRNAVLGGRIPAKTMDAYAQGVADMNRSIRAMVKKEPRLVLLDLETRFHIISMVAPEKMSLGKIRLERLKAGNHPDFAFLADERHPGTIVQGYVARLILDILAEKMDVPVEPLEWSEIDQFARRLWARESQNRLGNAPVGGVRPTPIPTPPPSSGFATTAAGLRSVRDASGSTAASAVGNAPLP